MFKLGDILIPVITVILVSCVAFWSGYKTEKNKIVFAHHSIPVIACDANGNPQLVTER